jgi:hypothetical protein
MLSVTLAVVALGIGVAACGGGQTTTTTTTTKTTTAAAPPPPRRTYAAFRDQLRQSPSQIARVAMKTRSNSLFVQVTNGDVYEVSKYPARDEARIVSDLDAHHIPTAFP